MEITYIPYTKKQLEEQDISWMDGLVATMMYGVLYGFYEISIGAGDFTHYGRYIQPTLQGNGIKCVVCEDGRGGAVVKDFVESFSCELEDENERQFMGFIFRQIAMKAFGSDFGDIFIKIGDEYLSPENFYLLKELGW